MLVVRMATEEVDSGKLKLLFAVIACFLVECAGGLLHANNLALHLVDVLHVILHFVVVFVDALYLSLEFCDEKLLEDFESQHVSLRGGLALQPGSSFLLLFGVLGV